MIGGQGCSERWMTAVLLLLAELQMGTSQCTQQGPCVCVSDLGTIDLTPIQGSPAFKDQLDTSGQWVFSYSPCTPFTEGSQECTDVSVCQLSSDQSSSYPTGTVDSAQFGYDGTTGSTTITYSKTDSQGTTRTTVVQLLCDNSGGQDALTVYGEDPTMPATYDLTLSSVHCCPSSSPAPGPTPSNGGGGGGGLSVGSILCITAVALAVVYLVAGVAVQKGLRKASGKEVLPNYTLWVALPGLIKDGTLFVFRKMKGNSGYDKV